MLFLKFAHQIAGLHEELAQERLVREETENAMLKMLEDMLSRLQSQIASERRDRYVACDVHVDCALVYGVLDTCRESAESGLLRLLEETCSRVESGLSPAYGKVDPLR